MWPLIRRGRPVKSDNVCLLGGRNPHRDHQQSIRDVARRRRRTGGGGGGGEGLKRGGGGAWEGVG